MDQLLNFFNPKYYGGLPPESIPDNIKDYLVWPWQSFKVTFLMATFFFLADFSIGTFDVPDWVILLFYVQLIIALLLTTYTIILFTLFVIFAISDHAYFWLILQKASVLLLNIPIAVLYFYILNM